jgi:iron complex transport system substrate-binding protein
MKKIWYIVITMLIIGAILCAGCTQQAAQSEKTTAKQDTSTPGFKTVADSRGVSVKVPTEIHRVVTISDGLVEGVMIRFGVQDTLVGVGSSCIQRNFTYEFPSVKGKNVTYVRGMNPVLYLDPKIGTLPRIGESSVAINYETLAGLKPDVVILRLGDCTLRYPDDENVKKTISTIESLNIPLVVTYGPNAYKTATVSGISDEIRIIGDVFGKETQADELSQYLEGQVNMIRERTRNIPDAKKPSILILGLSPTARSQGGAGQVFGTGTIESFFIQDLVNAKNSYQDDSTGFKTLSAEQILANNPDKIVLCTANGYHPPMELYEAPYYQNLQGLSAVKNQQVSALPWTPCNCGKRLEYPIDVMVIAKAAYPEKFTDIQLSDWLLQFYENLYGVDETTAKQLRSVQWMDWTVTG